METDQSTAIDSERQGASAGGGRRKSLLVTVPLVLLALVLGATALVVSCSGEEAREPQTIVFEVPKGTAQRQRAGEEIEIMPADLEMKVGDTIRIVNNDDIVQIVGPYTVGAGQTLRQTFTEPGTIVGTCSLSATGEVRINITA